MEELIELIVKNGDAVDKALYLYMAFVARKFTKRFDETSERNDSITANFQKDIKNISDSFAELNIGIQKLIVRHDNQEEKVTELEEQMDRVRERWHDQVSPTLSKINLNAENIKEIKGRLNGL